MANETEDTAPEDGGPPDAKGKSARPRVQLFGAILGALATKGGQFVLSFVASLIVTRSLGPSGRGEVRLLLQTAELATGLLATGATKALIYHGAGERGAAFFPLFFSHYLLRLLALSILVPLVLSLPIDALDPLRTPWRISVTVAVAWAITTEGWARAFLRSVLAFRRVNVTQIKGTATRVMALVVLALAKVLDVLQVAAARMLPVLWLLPAVLRAARERGYRFRPRWNTQLNREITATGTAFFIYAVSDQLHLRADVYLVQHFWNSHEVGLYTAGVQIVQMLTQLPGAVQSVLLPASIGGDSEQRALAIARVSRTVGFLMTMAALSVAVAAPFALPILYGQEFARSSSVTQWLSPGIAARAFFQLTVVFLASRGRVREVAMISVSGLLINLAGNWYAIPRFGIDGAAVVSSLSYSLSAAAVLFAFTRASGVPLRRVLILEGDDVRGLLRRLRRRKGRRSKP